MTETTERPTINIPQMCKQHQALLIYQTGIPRSGPWQSLIVMAQIALFQGATTDPGFHARLGGDITKTEGLGCLACFRPDRFGEVVEAAKASQTDPGALKRLGDSWVTSGLKKEETPDGD